MLTYLLAGKHLLRTSLAVLESHAADLDKLEDVMDLLFHLGPQSGCPPMLKATANGGLRPTVRVTFATLIMYYPERHIHTEMTYVKKAMCDAYNERYATHSINGDAHDVYMRWGAIIKEKFNCDNLHLNRDVGPPDMTQRYTQVYTYISRCTDTHTGSHTDNGVPFISNPPHLIILI